MNKMEQIKVKEVPIWTAQMLDMLGKKKFKVIGKEIVDTDTSICGWEISPKGTKKVIVIYLG